MSRGEVPAPEQEKGHYVYKVLLASGKKKKIDAFSLAVSAAERKGKLTILAKDVSSKTKLLRHIDQLRIWVAASNDDLDLPNDVVATLDYFAETDKTLVEIKASTRKEVDVWLKWNVKEQTAPFQLRGGKLDVREEKERQANGAVLRRCHYVLRGEMRLVIQYRDRMLENRLADPMSFKYSFWAGEKSR